MRGAVGGVGHSSIPVPAVGLGACIPKTEVGAQGAKTHRHSISAAAAYQGGQDEGAVAINVNQNQVKSIQIQTPAAHLGPAI